MTDFGARADQKVARTNRMGRPGFELPRPEGWGCESREAPADGSTRSGHRRSVEELEKSAATEQRVGCVKRRGGLASHAESIVECGRASHSGTGTEPVEEVAVEKGVREGRRECDASMRRC